MGRPKLENPRIKQYRIRLTAEEFDKWQEIAEHTGQDISRLLRGFMENAYDFLKEKETEDGSKERQ